jgi:excisionase family DNA binding protein
MSEDRVPLYVRLPRAQAAALDQLVASTGRRKQQLVSDLLSDRLVVGRAEPAVPTEPGPGAEVLTLEEAAALLRVDPAVLAERAGAGELPGRRLGSEWRFVRTALIDWLLQGESPAS